MGPREDPAGGQEDVRHGGGKGGVEMQQPREEKVSVWQGGYQRWPRRSVLDQKAAKAFAASEILSFRRLRTCLKPIFSF